MTATVSSQQVRAARMHSLLLQERSPRTPLEVTTWFGALQAQDAASGHWSLGVRCQGSSEKRIVDAFEAADIVRTWPMRGTIHIVPAQDVRWMLDLTGVRALAGAARRREQLGLTLKHVERATAALVATLADRRMLTRAEAIAVMADAGLDVTGQRSYHLLWHAAQVGVTCIGPQRGTDQTFVLLEEWAPQQVTMTHEEALAELFFRYVRSHGPVSLPDFARWTSLPLGDTRRAVAANAGRIEPVASEVGELWVTGDLAGRLWEGSLANHALTVLPGFDEFLLGYKDRSLQLPDGAMERVVPGGNGMFRATVVADGIVIGTWTRTLRREQVVVAVERLRRWSKQEEQDALAAFEEYAQYLGRKLHLTVEG